MTETIKWPDDIKWLGKDEKVNDDWHNETILWGGFYWEEEEDGTWTKRLKVDRFNGDKIRDVVESGVSRKEYFARKLSGDL